ncbi:BREX system P-loop protein BrxC, partial [Xinfangfangia sp. CPCC 101601]|nr:BREX system P-loop protein BrxC [Xinfangfangia sp. CPCC 101601]
RRRPRRNRHLLAMTQERVLTLVDKVYTNLPMLRQQSYSENDIAKVMKDDSGFFGAEGMSLTEPQQEILNYANSQGRIGGRVTAKSLIEHFGKKPFGWPVNAVLTNTAALVARSKLEAASDGVQLEGNDLVQGLRNSNLLSNIILTPQAEFQPSQIKKLREFYKEFFGSPLDGSDAKVIGAETAKAFEELTTALRTLLAEKPQFPFLEALQEVMPLLEQVNRKPATWYLTDLSPFEDKLLDANDDIITPIRSFMGGPQKAIYAEVSRFLIDQAHNFGFINAPEIETLTTALADPDFYRNKSKMDLKVLYLEIKNKLELAIIAERDSAKVVIEGLKYKLQTLPQIADLTFDQRSAIDHRLNAAQSDLAGASQIALIRSKSHDAEATLYPSLVETVIQQAHANTAPKPAPTPGAAEGPAPAPVKPAPQTVRRKDITPEFNKSILSHEQDVEAYLDTLRTAYLAAIHSGKEIIV